MGDAFEMATEENGLLDIRNERASLDRKRRRIVELYKDDLIDRAQFDGEVGAIDNRLRTLVSGERSLLELTTQEFERIGDSWALTAPGEKRDMIRCVFDSLACRVPYGAASGGRHEAWIPLRDGSNRGDEGFAESPIYPYVFRDVLKYDPLITHPAERAVSSG